MITRRSFFATIAGLASAAIAGPAIAAKPDYEDWRRGYRIVDRLSRGFPVRTKEGRHIWLTGARRGTSQYEAARRWEQTTNRLIDELDKFEPLEGVLRRVERTQSEAI